MQPASYVTEQDDHKTKKEKSTTKRKFLNYTLKRQLPVLFFCMGKQKATITKKGKNSSITSLKPKAGLIYQEENN